MSRLRRAALAIMTMSSMATGVGLATSALSSPAYAGINGQQAEIITYTGWSATINGCNQNGWCFTTPCLGLPTVDNLMNGYWWVGRTVVRIFPTTDCSGPDNGGLSEVVPQVQFGSDYWTFDFRPS
jgi:hypothetical protein